MTRRTTLLALAMVATISAPARAGYELLWSLPGVSVSLPGPGFQPSYLGDVDGDHRPELVAVPGGNYYDLVILDPVLGTPEFTYHGSQLIYAVSLVDLDADGTPEIVFGSYDSQASLPHWNVYGVIDWTGPAASTEEASAATPVFQLEPAVPNPTGDQLTARFALAKRASVGMRILDVQGREVLSVAQRIHEAGAGIIAVPLRSASGDALPGGVYFVEYSIDGQPAAVQRTVVVR